MDRRQFVKGAASTIVIAPALLQLGACEDDEGTAADGGGGTAGTQAGTTSNAGTSGNAGNGNAGASSTAGTSGTLDGSVLGDGSIDEDSGTAPGDAGGGDKLDASMDSSIADASEDTSVLACPSGAADTNITNNHGHSVAISRDDIVAGVGKTFPVAGPHPHSITLSGQQLDFILAGNSLTVTTTGGDHPHDVTIACV